MSDYRQKRFVVILLMPLFFVMAISDFSAFAADDKPKPAAQSPSTDFSNSAMGNTMCPVLPDEPADMNIWVNYQGKRVYFCCNRCKVKFERNPSAYAAILAQWDADRSANAEPGEVAGDGHAHDNQPADHQSSINGNTTDHAAAKLETDHDHSTDHADQVKQKSLFKRLVHWVGKFHPIMVHFPIGLLITAALAEFLFMLTGNNKYDRAIDLMVTFGAIAAILAVVLGWSLEGIEIVDDRWLMTTHRWIGTFAGLWSILLLIISRKSLTHGRRDNRAGYRTLLFTGAVIVSLAGFFGGSLVYGLDHLAW